MWVAETCEFTHIKPSLEVLGGSVALTSCRVYVYRKTPLRREKQQGTGSHIRAEDVA
jgi:hypothetical protein